MADRTWNSLGPNPTLSVREESTRRRRESSAGSGSDEVTVNQVEPSGSRRTRNVGTTISPPSDRAKGSAPMATGARGPSHSMAPSPAATSSPARLPSKWRARRAATPHPARLRPPGCSQRKPSSPASAARSRPARSGPARSASASRATVVATSRVPVRGGPVRGGGAVTTGSRPEAGRSRPTGSGVPRRGTRPRPRRRPECRRAGDRRPSGADSGRRSRPTGRRRSGGRPG